MDFEPSPRCSEFKERLTAFMDEHIYPNEAIYEQQIRESGNPHHQPAIMEELKRLARDAGLWNMFLPDEEHGAGLSNSDYAPLAEILGRSRIAAEVCNCSAPDTGNMEVLTLFGTPEQKERWLAPLLDGEIRSAFAMTEPAVASSDATNIELRIERDGDEYVLNGRKWWTSNAFHPNARIMIVMGKTQPDAPTYTQQSQILVPIDTPGVSVMRNLPVFGYHDHEGHAEVDFVDVRVPASNLIANEGDGFLISQARLGPGRIHHCMRSVGAAERALELMCRRAASRVTFGQPVSERANIQDWIAESRIDIEMVRLLTMKAAWLMDTVGNRLARTEIAAIKVAAPNVALRVIDRAIQVHGGGGVSDDFPLAWMYAHLRTLRLADGPDGVLAKKLVGVGAAVVVVLGVLIGLYVAALGHEPAAERSRRTAPPSRAGTGGSQLTLETVAAVGPNTAHPTPTGSPTRSRTTASGSTARSTPVPAHTLVHVTIYQYDGDSGLRNPLLSQVQGTVGGTETVDGRTIDAINPEEASHTFVVPQLGAVRAASGRPHSEAKNQCGSGGDPAKEAAHRTITFTFRTGKKGRYRWQCFVPCAAGLHRWLRPPDADARLAWTVPRMWSSDAVEPNHRTALRRDLLETSPPIATPIVILLLGSDPAARERQRTGIGARHRQHRLARDGHARCC